MWTQDKWDASVNARMREIADWQRRHRKDDRREAVVASAFRWLSMMRGDFPELAPRLSDDRLRAIAEGVADAFLGA